MKFNFTLVKCENSPFFKMDEEAMWKNLYETMQEAKTLPPTEHESQYVNYSVK